MLIIFLLLLFYKLIFSFSGFTPLEIVIAIYRDLLHTEAMAKFIRRLYHWESPITRSTYLTKSLFSTKTTFRQIQTFTFAFPTTSTTTAAGENTTVFLLPPFMNYGDLMLTVPVVSIVPEVIQKQKQ